MRVFVAGHRGLLGSSLVNILSSDKNITLITRERNELNLVDAPAVCSFFRDNKPEVVIMAAGLVGGIESNRLYPCDFLMTNLKIQTSLFDASAHHEVKRIIFFGSSCMYPVNCPQPMKESSLWSGPVEPTSKSYAVAKLAGVEMALAHKHSLGIDALTIIPSVMYGPRDNFSGNGHVIPSLIRKFSDAKNANKKTVTLFGTGSPIRDFVYVDDVSRFCLNLLSHHQFPISICNIGSERGVTIKALSSMVASTVGYFGEILWDTNKPDGAPIKILDCSAAKTLGWSSATPLDVGIHLACSWYLSQA